jgi:hypothetical protein
MNKRWRKVTLYVFLPIVVIIGAFCIGFWLNTMAIISVANQFKPDSSWTLKGETIVPSRPCIASSGPCPRVGRTWETRSTVSQEELQDILNQSGWHDVKIQYPNCYKKSDDINKSFGCLADGTADGYNISIDINIDDPVLKTPTITLYVH